MAFDRLQQLGKEKFQTIVNQLMREAPAKTLARMIEQEWGDAQNVGEDTLPVLKAPEGLSVSTLVP